MFRYFYQLCLVIFLGQGVLLPLLVISAGWLWTRQNRRLEALKKELGQSAQKAARTLKTLDSILEKLPKLQPLSCSSCGAGLLLKENQTLCPNCESAGPLPTDYSVTLSLKTQIKQLLKSAMRHWWVASLLTWQPVTWLFFVLIFAEPLIIFPTVLIGSNLFPDTWFDQAFKTAGETTTFLIMLSAFFGFVIWMVVFIFLNQLSKSLRRKLPLVPVLENESRALAVANCQACGGGIQYEERAFASICDYCHVENFRAQFARRQRAQSERQTTDTKSILFGAMEIIDDFIGTFFFVMLFLVGAALLLAGFYALKNLL